MTLRAVFVVALAFAAAACAGGGGDKAGGAAEPVAQAVAKPVGKPVTLTLVAVDELWATEFAAAAARLSGGSIRIRTRVGGQWILDYERTLVGHVRAGRADLASVGARAWDRMGVTSFQGLVAPLLVDSLELEQRVLESAAARRALEDVRPFGLVGLALLPGPLRRPFGLSRPLLGPGDYRGAAIGLRFGRVADSTLRALGATPKPYRIGSLAGLDGAELDAGTIRNNQYDARGSRLTGNVVLWARPETIVIGRGVFARLAPAQRDVLRRAGRAAVAPVRARIEREQREALAELCGRGTLVVADAFAAQRAALAAAVRPVVAALERDPGTRRLIAEIRRLKGGADGDRLRCAETRAAASALEGRWSASSTREAFLASGAEPREVRGGRSTATLEFHGGQWSARLLTRSWTGSYVVSGERLRLTLETCTHNPCDPGATAIHAWSVYRDTLSLTSVPGGQGWWLATTAPWRRVAS